MLKSIIIVQICKDNGETIDIYKMIFFYIIFIFIELYYAKYVYFNIDTIKSNKSKLYSF